MYEHEAEYNYLEDIFEKEGQHITIVYGMNQIGKSFFLKQFALFHEGIFFSTKPGSAKEIRRNFARHLGILQDENANDLVPSYQDIFDAIYREDRKKYVLVIDKFDSIIKADQTFFPELVAYLQTQVKDCMICFLSSHIGFVENHLISKIGQSASSITGFLKMQEMSFDELCEYYEGYSTYEVLKLYTMVGGQHGYVTCMSNERTVEENIRKCLLNDHSYILANMQKYIEEQLRETGVYYTILEALARGNSKLNDMYHYTGFSRAKISVYLKALMELEFVEKVFSVDTPGRVNVQKGIYRISNPLLQFYFRFIYPNESDFTLLDSEEFYYNYIENNLDHMLVTQFRKICRNMLIAMNDAEDLPISCIVVGEWVGKKGTIPMIAYNEQDECLVGFCNDTKTVFTLDSYFEQIKLLEEAKIEPSYVYLFSINGFEDRLQRYQDENRAIILIDME